MDINVLDKSSGPTHTTTYPC